MVLFIKQKVFSLGDRFTVKDDSGTDRWFVRGEVFRIGKRLHVEDAGGREVLEVRQRLLSWLPRFELRIGGALVATVRQRWAWFRTRFEVEGPGITVEGQFGDHEFTAREGSRLLMSVTKEWFSWGDSYRLDISKADQELLCVGLVLAIDAAQEAERNH